MFSMYHYVAYFVIFILRKYEKIIYLYILDVSAHQVFWEFTASAFWYHHTGVMYR
jgi:hypothetical protein